MLRLATHCRRGVQPLERVRGVETGACPHCAIRDDAAMNLEAICVLGAQFTAQSTC